jgi:hypothetical protein
VMAAVTYSGDSTYPRTITNGGNNPLGTTFYPDLVWQKARSTTYDHIVYDSVRGTGTSKSLSTNNTQAEGYNSAYANLTAFTSSGFTVGTTSGTNVLNNSGQTYVAWQWNAGSGTSSSNTNGSITSTVSVNATAGFSIVSFASDTSADRTAGHGLGVAPTFIIMKSRDSASYNWAIYHASVCTTVKKYLTFTTSALSDNGSNIWGSAFPTSTVFGFTSGNGVVASTNCIAYCFAPVAGYSAFGSYTGNGSSDGPFVYCGFRPRWVMVKRTDVSNDWFILDTSRNTYNVAGTALYPSDASSETTNGFYDSDIVSNGFKVRATNSVVNASGGTYIYAAFAENPFRNALAR